MVGPVRDRKQSMSRKSLTVQDDVQDGTDATSASIHRRRIGLVDPSFYIIGVGASAGGLEAIRQLIGQAAPVFPHTFVIIQHLSPDHKSLMTEILSRETDLEVEEVTDDAPVEPGKIYLIPPRSNIVIQGTIDDTQPDKKDSLLGLKKGLRFSLIASQPRPQLNLPIDLFFHSLAEAVGDRGIGIVLSGTGTDGSRGLRSIKDRDGFVIVQDPDTADFDGMPTAALATKLVDLVAPPDAMISELQRYIALREEGIFDIDGLFRGNEAAFEGLIEKVSITASIDFSDYKSPTLKRRIARRIGLTNAGTVAKYMEYVADNPQELSILHREFLIGVTNFFRDLPAWNAIRDEIAEKLFAEGDTTQPVKIWSVGCSTGEEAYTIGFLLEEYRRKYDIERDFKIFASDVNADAIKSAKEGIYPSSVFEEIPEQYRNDHYIRYFGGTFKIASVITNKIIFREHNVLEEAPYINTDLVVCRNFLIYLGADMQAKTVSLFSFSLRKGGYLFLGAAENMSHRTTRFVDEIATLRIFKNIGSRSAIVDTQKLRYPGKHAAPLPRLRRLAAREAQRAQTTIGATLGSVLRCVDGGVFVIDESGNITETFGDYRAFVDFPDEAFSANIFDLVHDRLKSSLSLLLRQAESEGRAQSLGAKCTFGDRIDEIDVFVERAEIETVAPIYTVVLRKTREVALSSVDQPKWPSNAPEVDQALVAKLESEVEALREMLKLTSEDLGISNEELQTANEELTVSNEELQANNEEMQSINEELHTVNSENSEKIVLLETANADIDDLLSTAELAVVLLESDLTIRRFNEAFLRYFDLNEADIGRKLSSFASKFEPNGLDLLVEDTHNALLGKTETERELRLTTGDWALSRTRPLKGTESQGNAGVAVTILDITELKSLRAAAVSAKE